MEKIIGKLLVHLRQESSTILVRLIDGDIIEINPLSVTRTDDCSIHLECNNQDQQILFTDIVAIVEQ